MLNSRLKIEDRDIPLTSARHDAIYRAYNPDMDFEETHKKFAQESRFTQLKLNGEILKPLQDCIPDVFSNYGWHGFSNIYQEHTENRSTAYGGVGLSYNPHFAHAVSPLKQVMGEGRSNLPLDFLTTPKGKEFLNYLLEDQVDKYFFYTVLKNDFESAQQWILNHPDVFDKEYVLTNLKVILQKFNSNRIKDTYTDSYGFTAMTEAALCPPIHNFLKLFPMTLVRSRLVEMRSHELDSHKAQFYWHRDNYPWIEYRVLICLTATHGGFGIEMKDEGKFYLSPGDVFTFDTSKPHRAFSESFDVGSRTCMVLGFSPWIDYNLKNKTWEKNQYFGKKHPNHFLKGFVDSKIFTNSIQKVG